MTNPNLTLQGALTICTPEQKAELMVAFNSEIQYLLMLDLTFFIGVHVPDPPPKNFWVIERRGDWVFGKKLAEVAK